MPKKSTQPEDVATRVVDATTPPTKRALTEEQKAKMREGRKLAAERRKASSSPEDPVQGGDQSSGSEDKPASPKRKDVQDEINALEAQLLDVTKRLIDAKARLAECDSSSDEDDDLPKFKADGTLDKRFKASKMISRADGGLDLRYKITKNAMKKGLVEADGTIVSPVTE
jgi:hypothetical protein